MVEFRGGVRVGEEDGDAGGGGDGVREVDPVADGGAVFLGAESDGEVVFWREGRGGGGRRGAEGGVVASDFEGVDVAHGGEEGETRHLG